MIEFSDNKPIYRQIVDHACNLILNGSWEPGSRVPSVRELAADLGVNTRTILKAMEELLDSGVIFSRRGMGYILAEDAPEKVREELRKDFFNTTVSNLKLEMRLLGISPEELFSALQEN
ncbi:MAG: GntR family transcriptional regulator [Bacteroidales bacterium]|nr:GntR family transcriptional regulator [Bacteroidales bacterium]MDE6237679.1 GntR family transcriptional regulator [Muribaculaceae bacterium]MDE6537905.1 GntR family transcriptional regulator [Muribaculaceae bacterium]MDE6867285.1 GntR family transcriptional regulator [Muribaculaceae bacterium]